MQKNVWKNHIIGAVVTLTDAVHQSMAMIKICSVLVLEPVWKNAKINGPDFKLYQPMKNILLFCLLLPSLYYSQDFRFTYNYKFVADTLEKDTVSEELVVLDFNKKEKHSVFTGLKHIISDSAMRVQAERGVMAFPDPSMKVRYVIEKSSDGPLYFYSHNHAPDAVMKVKEQRALIWKISDEKRNLMGYNTQKATATFGGRQWTAWFTAEIPISDGPYKFHGLPGLILEVSDHTNTHTFSIVSIQKNKSHYLVLNDPTYKAAKSITLEEYEKISQESPLERFKKKAFTGDIIFNTDEEKQGFLKSMDAKIKESKIHDNNPIELLTN